MNEVSSTVRPIIVCFKTRSVVTGVEYFSVPFVTALFYHKPYNVVIGVDDRYRLTYLEFLYYHSTSPCSSAPI